jgi:hydroxymethylglutaryl-CoA lyase
MSVDLLNKELLIEDEALRDGFQMESRIFPLEEKLELFRILKAAGLRRIQVGSFVHPKIVPQMADTDDLVRAIPEEDKQLASALILNAKGLERALACGVRNLSMSVSVSNTHSLKNARMPAEEALTGMAALIRSALAAGMNVRAGLQCAFGCVYEGPIAETVVLKAAQTLVQAGATEINLADTTGMANPASIRRLVDQVRGQFPEIRVSLHLHDTRGLALANMSAGFEAGIRVFDTCVGGLGGCPFVKGAAGNIPTEDAVHMFDAMGVPTGIDIRVLCRAVMYLEERLGRTLPGRMKRVLEFQGTCDA